MVVSSMIQKKAMATTRLHSLQSFVSQIVLHLLYFMVLQSHNLLSSKPNVKKWKKWKKKWKCPSKQKAKLLVDLLVLAIVATAVFTSVLKNILVISKSAMFQLKQKPLNQ